MAILAHEKLSPIVIGKLTGIFIAAVDPVDRYRSIVNYDYSLVTTQKVRHAWSWLYADVNLYASAIKICVCSYLCC